MKKILALFLSLALLCAGAPAGAYRSYGPPAWAQDAYNSLHENNVYPGGYSGPISRGDFLDLLLSTLEAALPGGTLDGVTPAPADYFCDNYETQYWAERMDLAAGCGLTEGSPDPFDPALRRGNFENTLTRAEAAKMICSALDFCAGQGYEAQPLGQSAVYSDAAAIPGWAAPFTGRVAAYGIMKGDEARRFSPRGELDWPSAAVMADRVLGLIGPVVERLRPGVTLHSQLDWANAWNQWDSAMARPLTGYAKGYYAISNGDGTLSGLVVQGSGEDAKIAVERYDAQGNVADTKTLAMELPIFGAFLDGGDCFYLAFGQMNEEKDDSREVYRVVQYDRDWNRLGSVSVNGADSYTAQPYRSTVSRMALSDDGQTVVLYAARNRYDGHQSNITILMNTQPFSIQEVWGEVFPANHVSHSFGQFVRYDGGSLVTVDHGDAYPRSFVLQKDGESLDLLGIAGGIGQNVTHAIGSGFEVSRDGYLFLGCSALQQDFTAEEDAPWQVFLAYGDKDLQGAELRWITQGDSHVDTARLVKLADDAFLVLWGLGADVHYLTVDGKGQPTSEEAVLKGASMPTTQPVVDGGKVLWIGVDGDQRAAIYSIEP